jgi:hypothetical protein
MGALEFLNVESSAEDKYAKHYYADETEVDPP